MSVRLVKFLASAGAASRRGAGDLVKAGKVRVNGKTVLEPGLQVEESDLVECDGKRVTPAPKKYYVMLNKPRGYVCTNDDVHAEKKAVDLIDIPGVRLFSAGRLDKESEGMLLLSNDGDYVNALLHPRNRVLKRYVVKLAAELASDQLQRIRNGISDAGELLKVQSIAPLGKQCYEIYLNEGRKREIRRITAAVGAPTLRLKRVRTGHLDLGDLQPGQWRELSPQEVAASLVAEAPEK